MYNAKIKVVIAGDFCLDRRIEQMCLNKQPILFDKDSINALHNKDISIVNLESPLTTSNCAIQKIGPNLKANPSCISAIKYAGFDIAALANNHIMDFGEKGLLDTITTCNENGIKTVGAGKDSTEASKPLYSDFGSHKIAVINCAEHEFSIAEKSRPGANDFDPVSIYYQILQAQTHTKTVIVIVHGGYEHYNLPSPEFVKRLRFIADLGVTAVVAHHTHCPSGWEIHNNVPVFYGLGNFFFDRCENSNPGWFRGYFVNLEIDLIRGIVTGTDLFPYEQCKENVGINLLRRREKREFLESINHLSKIIGNNKKLEVKWDAQCESSVKIKYLTAILMSRKGMRRLLDYRISRKYLLKRWGLLRILNFVACDSHRELLIKTLKKSLENIL